MNDFQTSQTTPGCFWVSVLMQRRPANHRWLTHNWRVVGVVVNNRAKDQDKGPIKVRSSDEGEDFLWHGMPIKLYKDEVESYYHNLMAPTPNLYVITRNSDQGLPEPFLVSACFDEAHAYMEGEENAYPVPMPPEIYQWIESFVINHYAPERRYKRKRNDWKEGNRE